MRLATFHDRRGELRTGAVVGEHVIDLTQTVSSLPVPGSGGPQLPQRHPDAHGNTRDMLFPVDRIIEYVSQYMTLEPGDVIATGTPAGSGAFRDPPVWLKPGDRVRIDISRIGILEHSIG